MVRAILKAPGTDILVPIVFVALAMAWAGWAVGFGRASSSSDGLAVRVLVLAPTLFAWVTMVPAGSGALDVESLATNARPTVEGVKRLRADLDRFAAVLGFQLAVWVIWYGSFVRFQEAAVRVRGGFG